MPVKEFIGFQVIEFYRYRFESGSGTKVLREFWLGKRRRTVALPSSLGHATDETGSRNRRVWVGQTIHINFSHPNDDAGFRGLSRKRRAWLGKLGTRSRKRRHWDANGTIRGSAVLVKRLRDTEMAGQGCEKVAQKPRLDGCRALGLRFS